MSKTAFKMPATLLLLFLAGPLHQQLQAQRTPALNRPETYRFFQAPEGATFHHWLQRNGELQTHIVDPREIMSIIVEFAEAPAFLQGSGVYFYRIETPYFQKSRKMILLK